MIIGIESSCDESALALFDPEQGMRGEWVHSQIAKHEAYGGIVPDIASREHLAHFPRLIEKMAEVWEPGPEDLVAVTSGPGLAGCLALGIAAAQAVSIAYGLPLIGVNHLRGHAYSPFIALHAEDPQACALRFAEYLPHLGLIASGGNTILFRLEKNGDIHIIAQTVDDAAGEALDKGAKLLGMPYPGGPLIEKMAQEGDPRAYNFPRAFPEASKAAFSFSGLKTSLRYQLEKMSDDELDERMSDICASYEQAVVDALVRKTRQTIDKGAWKSLGISGGVANNKRLCAAFEKLAAHRHLPFFRAQPQHTGDNAAMIAFAAHMDPSHCRPDAIPLDPAWNLA
jgi:N6-L-threonylcarbamoyladenine synthase